MKPFFLLAGVVMFVMAYVCYVFEINLLFGVIRSRPFTIFTVPFAGIGALICVYGLLVPGRKSGGAIR